jgi:hypothetical protein
VILSLKQQQKSELSFFLKTKGKKRKGSIVNYRSFAITTRQTYGKTTVGLVWRNRKKISQIKTKYQRLLLLTIPPFNYFMPERG